MPGIDDQLPRQPGSYLLVLVLAADAAIQVGRLGRMGFQRGWYTYAGSAFGPGGLAARLSRHFRPVRQRHWHIDYLRVRAWSMEAWIAPGPPNREHQWAWNLASGPQAGTQVRGFGCSDCRCPSHLIYFERRPGETLIREKLGTGVVGLQLVPAAAQP
jgi:Uri superfamily endonuclease